MIKRMTRPIRGFKAFWSAATTIAGIEIMHVIRKASRAPRGSEAWRSRSTASKDSPVHRSRTAPSALETNPPAELP